MNSVSPTHNCKPLCITFQLHGILIFFSPKAFAWLFQPLFFFPNGPFSFTYCFSWATVEGRRRQVSSFQRLIQPRCSWAQLDGARVTGSWCQKSLMYGREAEARTGQHGTAWVEPGLDPELLPTSPGLIPYHTAQPPPPHWCRKTWPGLAQQDGRPRPAPSLWGSLALSPLLCQLDHHSSSPAGLLVGRVCSTAFLPGHSSPHPLSLGNSPFLTCCGSGRASSDVRV